MRLILVRHGESMANETKTHNRREEPLTELGEAQAEAVAERLASERIDRAIVSTLLRAKQTADAILARHPHVPVSYDERIRECDNGVFSGKPHGSKQLAAKAQGIHPDDFRPEDGETWGDVHERVDAFLKDFLAKPSEETVLIVAHGGPIGIILYRLTDEGENFRRWLTRNTAVSIIDVSEETRVHVFDDVSHLADEQISGTASGK